MRQKKNRKKKKNRKIRILTGVVLGVGLAVSQLPRKAAIVCTVPVP